VLEAERYGVPQTRERAILIARNDGVVAHPPEPTHHRYMPNEPRPEASFDLFGGGLLPWVSMAEALGWHEGDRFLNGTHEHRAEWQADAPAPTLHFGARLNTVVREPWQPSDLVGFPRRADTPSNRAGDGVIEIDGEEYRERDLRTADQPAQHLTEKARSWQRWPGEAPDGQRRNSGPGAERDPRSVDDPSYTIRANGSGSHPSGVEWVHERPAPTFVSTRRSKDGVLIGRQMADGEGENVGGWGYGRPATTVAADPRVFPPGHKVNGDDVRAGRGGQRRSGAGHTDEAGSTAQAVRVTVDEAAALQSFPAGWPWQGTRTAQFTQVGNAVPPLLGEAVLRTLLPAERWRPRPT
jgi:DNA (cytosine-5)-methyltransferase 1